MQRYSAYYAGDPSQVGLWPDPDGYWVRYADTLPRVLTEADPEPAGVAVVLDRHEVAYQRLSVGWYPRGSSRGYPWSEMNFPVRLIWDGASDE